MVLCVNAMFNVDRLNNNMSIVRTVIVMLQYKLMSEVSMTPL